MWRTGILRGVNISEKLFKSLKPLRVFAPYSSSKKEASLLRSRSLVRIRGAEARPFLQGLITNDLGHLENRPAIYTLLLNHQGRVLFDALLFNVADDKESLLLECDSSFRSKVVGHLKLYRLKKKVDIEVEDKLAVWAVYNSKKNSTDNTG